MLLRQAFQHVSSFPTSILTALLAYFSEIFDEMQGTLRTPPPRHVLPAKGFLEQYVFEHFFPKTNRTICKNKQVIAVRKIPRNDGRL